MVQTLDYQHLKLFVGDGVCFFVIQKDFQVKDI